MRKIAGTILLGAFLAGPGFLSADDRRYYDREHHDYHNWDAREDKAYHMYYEQNHHEYRDWNRLRARDRADYWRWRHDHPNTVLNINVP